MCIYISESMVLSKQNTLQVKIVPFKLSVNQKAMGPLLVVHSKSVNPYVFSRPGDSSFDGSCILHCPLVVVKEKLMESFLTSPPSILQCAHSKLQELRTTTEQAASITCRLGCLHLVSSENPNFHPGFM